jgi:hypothetical protein
VTRSVEVRLTAAQQRALKWAASNHGLRCTSIDYGMQYGVTGAAFDAVADALERKGLISGDDGTITEAGETYLKGLVCTCGQVHCSQCGEDPACFAGSSFP